MSTQTTYQRKHREQGLCTLCPRRAVNASHCAKHRDAARKRARLAFRAKNPKARLNKCGACGKLGHNIATCEEWRGK